MAVSSKYTQDLSVLNGFSVSTWIVKRLDWKVARVTGSFVTSQKCYFARAAIFHPGCDGNPGWQCESSCPQVLAGFVFTEADASIGIKDVCLLPTGSKS